MTPGMLIFTFSSPITSIPHYTHCWRDSKAGRALLMAFRLHAWRGHELARGSHTFNVTGVGQSQKNKNKKSKVWLGQTNPREKAEERAFPSDIVCRVPCPKNIIENISPHVEETQEHWKPLAAVVGVVVLSNALVCKE
jgi:hypothetical protein